MTRWPWCRPARGCGFERATPDMRRARRRIARACGLRDAADGVPAVAWRAWHSAGIADRRDWFVHDLLPPDARARVHANQAIGIAHVCATSNARALGARRNGVANVA